MKRKPLVTYVGEMAVAHEWWSNETRYEPHTVFYSQVGNSGVYWISDRDRRSALLSRHYDEHHCPGGIWHCEEGKRLWDNLHPDDQIAIA